MDMGGYFFHNNAEKRMVLVLWYAIISIYIHTCFMSVMSVCYALIMHNVPVYYYTVLFKFNDR